MKKNIYAILDTKALIYGPLFLCNTDAEASRSFSAAINDPQHEYGRFPADYHLFKVGYYEQDKGLIGVCEGKGGQALPPQLVVAGDNLLRTPAEGNC